LIDDFGVLKPWPKLVGQLIAVFVLIRSGIRIEIAAFPDWLDLLLTVVWMIGIINAVNIIDVMDGLAGGVSVIACLWLFVVALVNHDTTVAVMLAALAGSLVGFLRYNLYPATIYLGDAGSLFVGLMRGALAMVSVATATALIIAGVAVLLAVVAAVWLTRVEMPRPAKGAVVPPAPESVRRAP